MELTDHNNNRKKNRPKKPGMRWGKNTETKLYWQEFSKRSRFPPLTWKTPPKSGPQTLFMEEMENIKIP